MSREDLDRGSADYLRTGAALSPFVGAVGYAGWKTYSGATPFVGQEGGLGFATGHAGKVATDLGVSGPLDYLQQNSSYFSDKAELPGSGVNREAWHQTMEQVDPMTKRKFSPLLQGFETMSPSELRSATETAFKRGDPKHTKSLFRTYRKNVEALKVHQDLTGQVPRFVRPGDFAENLISLRGNQAENALPKHFKKTLSSMSGITDVTYHSRQGWKEKGFGIAKVDFNSILGNYTVDVPLVSDGLMGSGRTMSGMQVAPTLDIIEGGKIVETVQRDSFFLRESKRLVDEGLASGTIKNKRDIKTLLGDFRKETIGKMEFVSNVPAGIESGIAESGRAKIRAFQSDLIVKKDSSRRVAGTSYYRAASERQKMAILEQGERFGGTAASATASSRVMRKNLAELHPAPELVDFGRSPQQAWRDWSPTQETLTNMEKHSKRRFAVTEALRSQSEKELFETMINPRVKTAFIRPDLKVGGQKFLGERVLVGDGESFGSKTLRDLVFENISSPQILRPEPGLAEAIDAGETFQPGQILGYDQKGPVTFKKGMRILGHTTHDSVSAGTHMRVHTMNQKNLANLSKIFGTKTVEHQMNEFDFARALAETTSNYSVLAGAERGVSMDYLKKDTGAAADQIISGMVQAATERERPGVFGPMNRVDTETAEFLADPLKHSKIWSNRAVNPVTSSFSVKGSVDPARYAQEAMNFASRTLGFNPQEMGGIFGSQPYLLGDEIAEGLARGAWGARAGVEEMVSELHKGVAMGAPMLSYGGPEELLGVGRMGSLEPRVFDILRGEAFEGVGDDISGDFLNRLHSTSPEKRGIHESLTTSLLSMDRDVGEVGGLSEFDLSTQRAEDMRGFLRSHPEGFMMNPGKGQRKIFVPGADVVTPMREFQTAGGQTVMGDLYGSYENIAEAAEKMHSDTSPLSPEDYNKTLKGNFDDLLRHQAPAGKGMGSAFRGKIAGSRQLRIASMTDAGPSSRITNPWAIGITESAASGMFEEMAETGLYDEGGLERMRGRFMSGESIAGMNLRHPNLGSFSAQMSQLQLVPGKGNAVVMPELLVENVRLEGSSTGVDMTLGPLVGLGADKDADSAVISLMDPEVERKMSAKLRSPDSAYKKSYAQHQLRYQLLKPGRAAAKQDLTILQKMAADTVKMGATETMVPQLSVAMTEAKRAHAMYGKGEVGGAAASLLEWIEQTPVSAKHASASDVRSGELRTLESELMHSFRFGRSTSESDVDLLEGSIRRMAGMNRGLSGDTSTSGLMLEKSVRLEKGSAEKISRTLGMNIDQDLKGMDIRGLIKDLFRSNEQFRSSGGAESAKILSGRGTHKVSRVAEELAKSSPGVQSRMSRIVQKASALKNVAAAAGKSILEHHRTIGFGFAASLGLATVLSTPRESVGPGSSLVPSGGINQPRTSVQTPEDLHPIGQEMGNPSVPSMMKNTVRIEGQGSSQQVHTSVHSGPVIDPVSAAAHLANLTGNKHKMAINLRDDRKAMTPELIANRLI